MRHAPALLLGAIAALAITLALTTNGYYVYVIANVALLVIVGAGLNLPIGLTGQISFGHVGFYAIGAYAVALLTAKAGWPFWFAWPVAAAIGGLAGLVLALPALRVRGPYLAMVTIAFGFIVQHAIVEMRGLTGGQNGVMGIASPGLGALAQGERAMAIIAILAACVAVAAFARISRGTWGAAMRAVRDSETAAESIGLNPLAVKTVAFALSAVFASAAGGLFAPLSGFVTPQAFEFVQSILFVLVVMIGGAGSVAGPVIGALVVGLLPEVLAGFEAYRLLFFGLLMLVVLWIAPRGAAGLWPPLRALLRRVVVRGARGARGAAKPPAQIASLPVAPPGDAPPVFARRRREPLTAAGLTMQFGGVRAVDDLSFDAPPASITSLIGPNGAGKTTALNMLSGFYAPSGGQFSLGARRLDGHASRTIARAGIARTYQTSQLFGSLDVLANVVLGMQRGTLGPLLGTARLRDRDARDRAARLLRWCGYAGDLDTKAADLAHVDRRLVETARALALDPDVLLLDEPAAGLSKEDKRALGILLQRIAQTGIAVVLVEHDMALVMEISERIVVLDAGQRLLTGTPASVQADPAVRRAYLGDAVADDGTRSQATARAVGRELLGVTGLGADYGAGPVLEGIDLSIREGEVVVLLGANGAGKSTLMRALAGLHRPVAGAMHLDGVDLAGLPAERIVDRGMVLVPEGRQVFRDLSVLDNLRLGAFLRSDDRDARIDAMLARFPRLGERLHQPAGLLSGGEQQMLAIARALMSVPRILLLDEPSLGLAPKVIAELFVALDRLRSEGMTLVVVDQMAGLALALADRACVIERGRIVASGTAQEVIADGALAQAYLGEQARAA